MSIASIAALPRHVAGALVLLRRGESARPLLGSNEPGRSRFLLCAYPFRKTGDHPRIKSEGRLFPRYARTHPAVPQPVRSRDRQINTLAEGSSPADQLFTARRSSILALFPCGRQPTRYRESQRLELLHERVRNVHSLFNRTLTHGEAACSGKPRTGLLLDRPCELRKARQCVATKRGGIEQDDQLTGAGRRALGVKKGRGFGREIRAGEPGGKELNHQRERRALGVTERQHGAAERRVRIGGRPAGVVERPALGNSLA